MNPNATRTQLGKRHEIDQIDLFAPIAATSVAPSKAQPQQGSALVQAPQQQQASLIVEEHAVLGVISVSGEATDGYVIRSEKISQATREFHVGLHAFD